MNTEKYIELSDKKFDSRCKILNLKRSKAKLLMQINNIEQELMAEENALFTVTSELDKVIALEKTFDWSKCS